MNIAIIGTGYVGLVSGACFADFGHSVICVDSDASRIARLTAGEIPFYEPGLAELVERNTAAGRLTFTTDTRHAVRESLVIFLAVGTPEGADGAADLSQVGSAAASIAASIDGYRVIVTKSTVPVGTGQWLGDQIRLLAGRPVDVDLVSNPEFLREGAAISDFMRPDRVVIGTSSERAAAAMREIYRPLFLIETPILVTDLPTAEMIKCASNAFLAVKISFMNEIANLAERMGADVEKVRVGIGSDPRIGYSFIYPGAGYGGSCFPKDVKALVHSASEHHFDAKLLKAVESVNRQQKQVLFQKMHAFFGGKLKGRTIAVWGLAFKPNTDDMREAPSRDLIEALWGAGARVRAYDPVAMNEATRIYGTRDDLADLTLLRPIVKRLGKRAKLHVIDGADHGFEVLVRSGRTNADVIDELARTTRAWIDATLDT